MEHNWENYFDISSEYWKKVEKIYEDSEHFPKKVVKDRNLHHKFPRSFSKKDGAEIDNDEDNLVSLSLADHFRVHYYLWKCSKKGYRGLMAKAFVFMRKKMVKYATDETIEQLAKDYEEAMKEAAEQHSKAIKGKRTGKDNSFYGKHHTEESKRRNSEAHKGKYLGKGNPFYGKHHTEETLKKMSKAHKGKTTWNKGKHHTDEARRKMSEAKKGTHHYEETRNKLSEALKAMRWFNNGEKCVRAKECPPGFTPGRVK